MRYMSVGIEIVFTELTLAVDGKPTMLIQCFEPCVMK